MKTQLNETVRKIIALLIILVMGITLKVIFPRYWFLAVF
jgi:hypothetical protein